MLSFKLPIELEKEFNNLQMKTKRTKTSLVIEALQNYIEDQEDYEDAIEILKKGDTKYYTSEEVDRMLEA